MTDPGTPTGAASSADAFRDQIRAASEPAPVPEPEPAHVPEPTTEPPADRARVGVDGVRDQIRAAADPAPAPASQLTVEPSPAAPAPAGVPDPSASGSAPAHPDADSSPDGPVAPDVPEPTAADTVAVPPAVDVARRTGRPALAAAVLAVAGVAAAVVFGLLWANARSDAHRATGRAATVSSSLDAASAATLAARQDAVYVASYDYQGVDAAFARVTDNATGAFKTDFAQTSTSLKPAIVAEKASAQGTVVDIAVKSADADTVVLLVFLDQKVTRGTAEPQTLQERLTMTMTKVDGRWLMANVQTV